MRNERLAALVNAADLVRQAEAAVAPYYPSIVAECEILSARIERTVNQERRIASGQRTP